MKIYLIILFIFISSFITAQTIVTDIVSNYPNVTELSVRKDVFHIKNNFIVWNSVEGSVIYYINSYTKLSDNIYLIKCNTNGKLADFLIDFVQNTIVLNNNLLFCKITKT